MMEDDLGIIGDNFDESELDDTTLLHSGSISYQQAQMMRKPEKAKWSVQEDSVLQQAVSMHDGKNWKSIASFLEGKTEVQCLHRWTKVLNPNLTKGPWTDDEDRLVVELVENAIPLPEFSHPDNAFYILGPEDGSVPIEIVNAAESVVYIPTFNSMNLGATGNVVLYDRLAKRHYDKSNQLIQQSRDNNNNHKI